MITDKNGNEWSSIDRTSWVNGNGHTVIVNPEWTDEQITTSINRFYCEAETPQKTDAERIAELEAQLQALLSKLG